MKDGVLDGQINLFDEVEEQDSVELAHRGFEAWLAAPAFLEIPENSPLRPDMVVTFCEGYFSGLWSDALHVCGKLPRGVYIWLNNYMTGEYWVEHRPGSVQGRKADVCPYCGADLKHGHGDVVFLKAGPWLWEHVQKQYGWTIDNYDQRKREREEIEERYLFPKQKGRNHETD